MKKTIAYSRRLVWRAEEEDSLRVRCLTLTAPAFRPALLALILIGGLGGVGVAQTQPQPSPDPLTITKDGNVGIGKTSPTNKLSVAGGADISGNVGIGTTAPTNKLSVSGNADFSGNVGIGTVTPANKLSVTGNADFSGNVGIGTTTPANKLSVAGGADVSGNLGLGTLSVSGNADFSGNVGIGTKAPANKLSVSGNLDVSGNVGIGTAPSTRAKLEVLGFGAVLANFGQVTLLRNNDSTTVRIPPGDANPTSIYADQGVAANSFWAFSDERLKRIKGRSNAARDLATLMEIEITDYSFVDSVSKGTRMQKKVTGQQVEKVFPQAVTKATDVIPDIYQLATMKDGWVMLATSLKKGDRVRLIGEKQGGIHEVLEIAEGRFRTAFAAPNGQIFVYGREVNDARSVDYEAISMLNVSATQELAARLERLEDIEAKLKLEQQAVKTLRDENAALRSQLDAQQKKLAEVEAKDKTRDEKLAALETLILSGDRAAVRTATLKKIN